MLEIIGGTALTLLPFIVAVLAEAHSKKKLKQYLLEHPDYALARKRLAYAEHRLTSHREKMLDPIHNEIWAIKRMSIPKDVKKEALKYYKGLLKFENGVADKLSAQYSDCQKMVKNLEKRYGIRT